MKRKIYDCISQGSQRNRTNTINIEIYYKGLIHTITDAEESHDLWSMSWRHRKAAVLVSFSPNLKA